MNVKHLLQAALHPANTGLREQLVGWYWSGFLGMQKPVGWSGARPTQSSFAAHVPQPGPQSVIPGTVGHAPADAGMGLSCQRPRSLYRTRSALPDCA